MLVLRPIADFTPVSPGLTYYVQDESGQSKISVLVVDGDSIKAKIIDIVHGSGFKSKAKDDAVTVTRAMLHVST
ncbi:MAG TPA: hypothetical protein VLI92_04175 [Candidatus Saccharimonadales bacterium]|nr:hypothetical protein [Candidatus Saccharimonadales bacterium]